MSQSRIRHIGLTRVSKRTSSQFLSWRLTRLLKTFIFDRVFNYSWLERAIPLVMLLQTGKTPDTLKTSKYLQTIISIQFEYSILLFLASIKNQLILCLRLFPVLWQHTAFLSCSSLYHVKPSFSSPLSPTDLCMLRMGCSCEKNARAIIWKFIVTLSRFFLF